MGDEKRMRFDNFQDQMKHLNVTIEKDNEYKQSLRDTVSLMDEHLQNAMANAQKIHTTKQEDIKIHVIEPTTSCLKQFREFYLSEFANKMSDTEYLKYQHLWSRSIQTYMFIQLLLNYLQDEELLTHKEFNEFTKYDDHLYDYLFALISLVNELTRLTVNTVIMNEFDRPKRISAFLKDVYQGLSLLNFKNDALRRKFDSLKYDLNKVEGVIYDLTLRNLN